VVRAAAKYGFFQHMSLPKWPIPGKNGQKLKKIAKNPKKTGEIPVFYLDFTP